MPKLIVSFTSYPERIHSVKRVLDSLYAQTFQADEIILWLAEEEFPKKEDGLPKELLDDLAARRFTLRWCDNIGSHKKYFYVMQEFPEDIIVTVDDDTYYHPNSLEKLMDAHNRFTGAVAALCTTLVEFDSELQPKPISEWLFDFHELKDPSILLMAIGVGGVLYPPHAVDKRVFDKKFIIENCTVKGKVCGDDILLKAGEMLKGTPVVSVYNEPYYRIPNTQETALWTLAPNEDHKNQIIKSFEETYGACFGEQSRKRLQTSISDFEQLDIKRELRKSYWLSRPSRDFSRSLGYLALSNHADSSRESDYVSVRRLVQMATRINCAYPSRDSNDDTNKMITLLRKQILELPEIDSFAEKDISIQALIENEALLNTGTNCFFRGQPIIKQSIINWISFFRNNPHCGFAYRKAFYKHLFEIFKVYAWRRFK